MCICICIYIYISLYIHIYIYIYIYILCIRMGRRGLPGAPEPQLLPEARGRRGHADREANTSICRRVYNS